MSTPERPRVLAIETEAPSPSLRSVAEYGVRVARLALDGEAAHRQAGQRADDIRRQCRERPGARQDVVDVPVGVVVGEDRLAQVGVGAGRAQVPRRREDRVDGVVGILAPVAVGVDAVRLPGARHELHPAERAGRAHVQVAAVVGLDLVDRGEDLPAHAVLDAGGLVDREQERRDPQRVDDDVRDAGDRRREERGRQVAERVGRGVGRGRRERRVLRLGLLLEEAASALATLLLGALLLGGRRDLVDLDLEAAEIGRCGGVGCLRRRGRSRGRRGRGGRGRRGSLTPGGRRLSLRLILSRSRARHCSESCHGGRGDGRCVPPAHHVPAVSTGIS